MVSTDHGGGKRRSGIGADHNAYVIPAERPVSQQSVGDQWDTVASEWRAHQRLGAIARTIELEADLQICSNRFTCGDGSPS
jgi:hypothetical protein